MKIATVLAAFVLYVQSSAASAEVRVTGHTDAVSIDLRDATMDQVLAALTATFGVVVRSSVPLDQPVSGIYNGSLPHVVSRLLVPYDYAAKRSDDKFEISIYGLRNGRASRPEIAKSAAMFSPVVTAPTPTSGSSLQPGPVFPAADAGALPAAKPILGNELPVRQADR